MTKMTKAAWVLMRLVEFAHYICTALGVVMLIVSIAAPGWTGAHLQQRLLPNPWYSAPQAEASWTNDMLAVGDTVSVYGFEVTIHAEDLSQALPELRGHLAVASVIMALMGLVFRQAADVFSLWRTGTPFHAGAVRCLRRMGWLYAAATLAGLLGSVVCRIVVLLAVRTYIPDYAMPWNGLLTALLLLCLSQAFAHGQSLQQDVDGLL